MTVATSQANGYFRNVPLHENEAYQTYTEITAADVPPLSATAEVANVTPRSIRYDDGRHTWYVDPRDKSVLRAYRLRRTAEDIEAGAFPNLKVYWDEKGPL